MLLPILKRRRRGQFNPVNLGGCVLWLDGADLSTITNAVSGVIGWADKSGLGNSAVQTTDAHRPVSGTRTINGRNALDFDGTSHRMLLPSGLYSIPAGDNTVFVAFSSDNLSSGTQRILGGVDATTGRYYLQRDMVLNTFAATNRTINSGATLTGLANNNGCHIGVLRRSINNINAIYDGNISPNATADNITITNFQIGANNSGVFFDGLIGEVMVFNRALSNSEMNIVGRALSAKWATPWTDM